MTTALILLAAGASKRFGPKDKLLAEAAGLTVLTRSAQIAKGAGFLRLAVIPAGDAEKAGILKASGWTIVVNPSPQDGQGSSIAAAFNRLKARPDIDQAIILLADMPLIDDAHISALLLASQSGALAVSSHINTTFCPPVLFKRPQFETLAALCGPKGAKSVFQSLPDTSAVPLPERQAQDIDTQADLRRVTRSILSD